MTASRQGARRVATPASGGARSVDRGVRVGDRHVLSDDQGARADQPPGIPGSVDGAASRRTPRVASESSRARDRARSARAFDRTFGPGFLRSVPAAPGVYRFYDDAGALLYVGKAGDLRRRLAQYRVTRRTRKDAKRRALVNAAASIVWDVCASEEAASLRELRLIQALSPRDNVASAFPFLYPYLGVHADGSETYFCFTTSPRQFAAFELHGAFRSRDVTAEAFFALRRLLTFVGHPIPRHRCARLGRARYSHVFGVRRLPAEWPAMWGRLFDGSSREAVERLSLRLLDHAGARARRALVKTRLAAIARFYADEAAELRRALATTGYRGYPLPQRHRDRVFLRYRRA
jgi:excinuclease ABC subunit C